MDNHVRIVRKRADRRLMGSPGISETLCGGPMTDRDISPAEARHDIGKGSWEWLVCEKCRSLIERDVASKVAEAERELRHGWPLDPRTAGPPVPAPELARAAPDGVDPPFSHFCEAEDCEQPAMWGESFCPKHQQEMLASMADARRDYVPRAERDEEAHLSDQRMWEYWEKRIEADWWAINDGVRDEMEGER